MKRLKRTVYFHQKLEHRERQKDTPRHANNIFNVISNLNETAAKKSPNNQSLRFKEFLTKYLLSFLPLIKFTKLPDIHKNADFVYTWFAIPFNSKKPYVIELDNPYTLTYYNYWAFKLLKPIIKSILLSTKCHKIVCMSEACRLSLISELGSDIKDKACVLYPYMPDNTGRLKKHNKLNFLFVGLDFIRKGGRETLRAFHELNDKDCELLIVGEVDKNIQAQYASDKRIKFLGVMKRDKLFNKVYPLADVLIFPTLHESFGMVALESLSFGLGIITTNTYALPELVINKQNGMLIPHPFLKPVHYGETSFVDVTKWTIPQFYKKFLKKDFCNSLFNSLKIAIFKASQDFKVWRNHSKKIFKNRFAEDIWEKTLLKIFE